MNTKYNTNVWLSMLVLFALQTVTGAVYAQTPEKNYNVLFIMSDDLNTDISSYGHQLVKTPNLDRLAERGIQFNRAYNQYPLCNPSRASIFTGLNPDITNVYDLGTHFREHVPDVVTLPQLYRNNGYYTARVGKIYHGGVRGGDGLDDSVSWDEAVNPLGRDWKELDKLINPMPKVDFGVAMAYLAADGTDEEQTDGIAATEAIELMQQNKDKPFFIAAGFYRPHTPYVAPKKYFDMYPLDQIVLPEEPAGVLNNIHLATLYTKPRNWGLSEMERKRIIRAYYASVTFMDAQIGRLLESLDRLKLMEKTIIVFVSDHGYLLGEHAGQWQKRNLFEKGARVPLIISVPEGEGVRGEESDRIIELVDLYPTLADLSDLPVTQELSGRSLKPLLLDPDAKWDKPAFTQIGISRTVRPRGKGITELSGFVAPHYYPENSMGKSVRTERWRYTEWDNGRHGIVLYDEENDPDEFINLAYDKEYKEQIKNLSKLLEDHFEN